LTPTATGQPFYQRANALLVNMQTMPRELSDMKQGDRGVMHLGCAMAASLFLVLRSEGVQNFV